MDDSVGEITERLIEQARLGDLAAIKIVMDRVVPPAKDIPLNVDLPPINCAADIPASSE